MRVKTVLISVFILTQFSACTFLSREAPGPENNHFERYPLNFLFKESFSLDYTSLKSSDWVRTYQSDTGAFAVTEVVPRGTAEYALPLERIMIAYYPVRTVPEAHALGTGVFYVRTHLAHACPQGVLSWKIVSNNGLEEFATGILDCPQMPVETLLSRLVLTQQGLHQLTYVKKGLMKTKEQEKMLDILKQAKLVKYGY